MPATNPEQQQQGRQQQWWQTMLTHHKAVPAHRRRPHWCPSATHGRHRRLITQQARSGDVIVQGVVSALTETLRALGIGQQQYAEIQQQAPIAQPLCAGDVAGVMQRIEQDFERAYFVTGVIDDSIYDPGCTFVDPTVRFSGLDLWKRNLQLLVPFLLQPTIKLKGMQRLQQERQQAGGLPQQLQADWTLETGLRLPWRPFISVQGSTIYTLNTESNRVVEHEESWDISAWQALLLIFTPGGQQRSSLD